MHPKDEPSKAAEKGRQMPPEEPSAYILDLIEENNRRLRQATPRASEIKCESCGRVCRSEAKFCNRCGTPFAPPPARVREETAAPVQAQDERPSPAQEPQPGNHPRNRWKRAGVALASVIGLVILAGIARVSLNANVQAPSQSQSATAVESATAAESAPAAESDGQSSASALDNGAASPAPVLTAAELLAAAKKALDDGYDSTGQSKAWGRVTDARGFLEQIPNDAPEFPEAERLLSEVRRREAEKQEWDNVVARESYAQTLERSYLDRGRDVAVTLAGEDKAVLRFQATPMSKQLIDQLTADPEFVDPLRQMGFKQVIFTGETPPTWTYDLTTNRIVASMQAKSAKAPPMASKKPGAVKPGPGVKTKIIPPATKWNSGKDAKQKKKDKYAESASSKMSEAKKQKKAEKKLKDKVKKN